MNFGMYVNTDSGYVSLMPFALIILVAALVFIWFRTRNLWHLIFAAVFGVYLVFAVDATFFPIRTNFDVPPISLGAALRSIDIVPFNYDFSFIPHIVWRQIFENILLTVPFGFGVSFVVRLKPRHFLWLIPAVGIALELTVFRYASAAHCPHHRHRRCDPQRPRRVDRLSVVPTVRVALCARDAPLRPASFRPVGLRL